MSAPAGLVAPVLATEGAIAALISVAAGERLAPGAAATLVLIAAGVVLATRANSRDVGSTDQSVPAALLALARSLHCDPMQTFDRLLWVFPAAFVVHVAEAFNTATRAPGVATSVGLVLPLWALLTCAAFARI